MPSVTVGSLWMKWNMLTLFFITSTSAAGNRTILGHHMQPQNPTLHTFTSISVRIQFSNPPSILHHIYTGHSHLCNNSNTQTAAITHLLTRFPLFVHNINQLELTGSCLLFLFYIWLYGDILINTHLWPPSGCMTSCWNHSKGPLSVCNNKRVVPCCNWPVI